MQKARTFRRIKNDTRFLWGRLSQRRTSTYCAFSVPDLTQRQRKIFCGHRIRLGPQWEHGRRVSELARSSWQPFCTLSESELTEAEFLRELCAHRFVICVDGGGWTRFPRLAAIWGLPSICRTALVAAYSHFPIAVVDDWTDQSLSLNKLKGWCERLGHRFNNPQERKHVFHRLTLEYWWRVAGCQLGNPLKACNSPPNRVRKPL